MSNTRRLLPVFIFLFFAFTAKAQEPVGGEQLSMVAFDDSLTSASEKTNDGFYYKGFPLTYETGSRLYIHYSAYGKKYKDLSLVFLDDDGKITRYHSDLLLDSPSGTIDLDTTFPASGKINILFTTEETGETFQYSAAAYYASPKAMAFNNEADLCWKTAFLLKHSDNGFRFITTGKVTAFSSSATTAPLRADAPNSSAVYGSVASLYYRSTLGRGTREQADAFFTQLEQTMKQCMGDQFEYKSENDENGLPKLVCSVSAARKGAVIRNLSYLSKKDEMLPKYVITLYLTETTVSGVKAYNVEYKLENKFYQF